MVLLLPFKELSVSNASMQDSISFSSRIYQLTALHVIAPVASADTGFFENANAGAFSELRLLELKGVYALSPKVWLSSSLFSLLHN